MYPSRYARACFENYSMCMRAWTFHISRYLQFLLITFRKITIRFASLKMFIIGREPHDVVVDHALEEVLTYIRRSVDDFPIGNSLERPRGCSRIHSSQIMLNKGWTAAKFFSNSTSFIFRHTLLPLSPPKETCSDGTARLNIFFHRPAYVLPNYQK